MQTIQKEHLTIIYLYYKNTVATNKIMSVGYLEIVFGPMFSGKTTAIIELIVQLAAQNKKILLCGSTQASIDNVLLRIKENENLQDIFYKGSEKHVQYLKPQ